MNHLTLFLSFENNILIGFSLLNSRLSVVGVINFYYIFAIKTLVKNQKIMNKICKGYILCIIYDMIHNLQQKKKRFKARFIRVT